MVCGFTTFNGSDAVVLLLLVDCLRLAMCPPTLTLFSSGTKPSNHLKEYGLEMINLTPLLVLKPGSSMMSLIVVRTSW
jgi:hypothetical protein